MGRLGATQLSSMPYQHIRLDGTQPLFAWMDDRAVTGSAYWIQAKFPNDTVEQSIQWWRRKGMCTARPHICQVCERRWGRRVQLKDAQFTVCCMSCIREHKLEVA